MHKQSFSGVCYDVLMTKTSLKKIQNSLKSQKDALVQNIIIMRQKSDNAYEKYGHGKIEPNTITIQYMGPVIKSLVDLVDAYETYIKELEKRIYTKRKKKYGK